MSFLPALLSRRQLLSQLGLLAAVAALSACSARLNIVNSARTKGLRDFASTQGKLFGTAVTSDALRDMSYANAIAQQANLLVPENELKWRVVQPQQGTFDFSGYNKLADFAKTNGMQMRGHTLVWHNGTPAWANDILQRGTRSDAQALLENHIASTIANTPQVNDWDVVNEAIDQHSTRPDFWRESLWLQALGLDYVPMAFTAARAANPQLMLTYNDYGLEYADGAAARRRDGVLRLLRFLDREGVRVDQLGLQSHLQCHRPLGGEAFNTFLKQVRGMGVRVIVTELDIDLSRVPGDAPARLQAGADYAATYLRQLQSVAPLDTVLTWGLGSPFSYKLRENPSALPPLPLDNALNPLPLWHALKQAWLNQDV